MIRRKRHIVVDREVVGWIVPRTDRLFSAYIAVGDGRYAHGVGATRERATEKAWSAHHVLCSEEETSTEETA